MSQLPPPTPYSNINQNHPLASNTGQGLGTPVGPVVLFKNPDEIKKLKKSVMFTCPYCKFTGMTYYREIEKISMFLFCLPCATPVNCHLCSRCREEISSDKFDSALCFGI